MLLISVCNGLEVFCLFPTSNFQRTSLSMTTFCSAVVKDLACPFIPNLVQEHRVLLRT